jgi:hypothetical protein
MLALYTRTSCLRLGKAADRSYRTYSSFSNQGEEVAAARSVVAWDPQQDYLISAG